MSFPLFLFSKKKIFKVDFFCLFDIDFRMLPQYLHVHHTVILQYVDWKQGLM